MANNNSYFDSDLDIIRNQRRKKRKRKKALKAFFTVLGLLVLGFATFFVTVKIGNPDMDLKTLVPNEIAKLVDSIGTKDNGGTPSGEEQTNPPAESSTRPTDDNAKPESDEPEMVDYLDFSEFDFNHSIQGNSLGNLLNGGLVSTDMTYEYHIVSGKGIYRFNPTTEEYTCFYHSKSDLSSLNLRGEYLYFINEGNGNLCKLKKGESKSTALAEGVKFAYVYDQSVYYITKTNSLCVMNLTDQNPKVLYTSDSGAMRFAGISLNGVFFTVSGDNKKVEYYYAETETGEVNYFRQATANGEILKLYIENGFMYYYQKQNDGTYDLCRQKFGSDKTVSLVEKALTDDYVIVDMNRVLFTKQQDGNYKLCEFNMNNEQEKTMLTIPSAGDENSLKPFHGAEYDFVIGKKEDGTRVYSASSMLTASTNVMKFSGSGWSY